MRRLFQPRRDPFWDPWHYVLEELGKMNDGPGSRAVVPKIDPASGCRKDRNAG